ncbi:MAG TPA: FAD-dependent oxidoreductase [Acidimicrobiia bacterium]|nr:FAD-dependent oxidoreductase [Acidimicrobiia bacterium]
MTIGPLQFYDENIPCLAACPIHTNAGAYVAAIADGEDEFAYLTARLPNPFASVCGQVCAAPCEDECRRGEIDRPIAIRALKRFVTEKYGVEAGSDKYKEVAGVASVDLPYSVGIVGGGPAGLSAAHDLRRFGYKVSLYEATGILGGMMVLGIPEYRLDRALLAAEIQAIVDMGVEVQLNTRLGADVTLAELRERHDAVFLSYGAFLGRGLDIPGGDADGILKAVEFLLNANQGFEVDIGEKVVVIGGGDVAMDAARTALRRDDYEIKAMEHQFEQGEQSAAITEALDAARTATRSGAAQVTVISLESRQELPASEFEIEEAIKEDITFIHRRGPARVLTNDAGQVTGLETVGVLSVFDENGRFSPTFDNDDVQLYEADTIILAIGQAVDVDALGVDGPVVSPRKTIQADPDTLETSIPMVWAGGDAAKGPRTLILGIADGRIAAAQIHKAFGGEIQEQEKGQMVQLEQFHRLDDIYDRIGRVGVPPVSRTPRQWAMSRLEGSSDGTRGIYAEAETQVQ